MRTRLFKTMNKFAFLLSLMGILGCTGNEAIDRVFATAPKPWNLTKRIESNNCSNVQGSFSNDGYVKVKNGERPFGLETLFSREISSTPAETYQFEFLTGDNYPTLKAVSEYRSVENVLDSVEGAIVHCENGVLVVSTHHDSGYWIFSNESDAPTSGIARSRDYFFYSNGTGDLYVAKQVVRHPSSQLFAVFDDKSVKFQVFVYWARFERTDEP